MEEAEDEGRVVQDVEGRRRRVFTIVYPNPHGSRALAFAHPRSFYPRNAVDPTAKEMAVDSKRPFHRVHAGLRERNEVWVGGERCECGECIGEYAGGGGVGVL